MKCGAEEEALKYLKLCYEENPEYIFTRGKVCIDLFCKHTGIKPPKEKAKVKRDYFESYVRLPVWEEFFEKMQKKYFIMSEGMNLNIDYQELIKLV